jgi:hypothetical protein
MASSNLGKATIDVEVRNATSLLRVVFGPFLGGLVEAVCAVSALGLLVYAFRWLWSLLLNA